MGFKPAPYRLFWAMVAILFGLARPAFAWDAVGHMQIADIAWSKLSRQTKREINAILRSGDPRFRPNSDAEEDVRDAFRRAATYPDVIKSDRNTLYEPIIPEMNSRFFKASPPDLNDNESLLCKTWHYYDTPIRGSAPHPIRDSNALNALDLARHELRRLERTSHIDRKMQCWWLYWTEHLVGDLHQPLHCASSYEFLPNGDAGGNLFPIADPGRPEGKGRLHGFWDAGIGSAIGIDRTQGLSPNVEEVSRRWSADPKLRPSRKVAAGLHVAEWIRDGARRADSLVYSGIQRNSSASAEYVQQQATLSRKMAVLAGFRLAAMLNSALSR